MLKERIPPSASRVLVLALAAWLAYFAARMGVRALLPVVDWRSFVEQDLAISVLRVSCLLFCWWLGRLRYDAATFWNRPGRPALAWAAGSLMATGMALEVFGRPWAEWNAWMSAVRGIEVAIAVLVAYNEEIGFRAALFEPLKENHGDQAALWITTVLFTAMHLGYQPLVAFPRIFLVGLALGLLRLKGVGLALLITIHFFLNLPYAVLLPNGEPSSWNWLAGSTVAIGALALGLAFVKPKESEAAMMKAGT